MLILRWFILKVQLVNKTLKCIVYLNSNTVHGKICITSHINLRSIYIQRPEVLGLILESRVEKGCDTEFAIYNIFFTCIIKTHMGYTCIHVALPFTIGRKTKKWSLKRRNCKKKKVYSFAKYFFSSIQQSSTHRNHLFTNSFHKFTFYFLISFYTRERRTWMFSLFLNFLNFVIIHNFFNSLLFKSFTLFNLLYFSYLRVILI